MIRTPPRRLPKHVPVLVEASLDKFGERLRMARKVREITMEQMASLSDVSLSTLRALESGADGVSMGNFLKVMKGLNLLEQFDGLLDAKHDPELVAYAQRTIGVR